MNRYRSILTAISLVFFFGYAATVFATDSEEKTIPAASDKIAAEKKPVPDKKEEPGFLSKLKIKLTPYGHLRLDAAWDENKSNSGNTAMWSSKPADDSEFNITCRHTRIGLDFKGPETMGVTPSGKLEIDFYGKGSEVLQNLRLRHAFLKFDLGSGFFILAGQTFDLHGPLFMRTLNTAVGWNAGNLCFRRSQLRFGIKTKMVGGFFLAEAGIARAIGMSSGGDLDGNNQDDGEDASMPDLQGNLTLAFPAWVEKKPIILSVGGHYGVERLEGIAYIKMWSVAANLTLPLGPWLILEGEIWAGQNLDSYKGGIGQGYNMTLKKEISSRGGFVQLLAGPFWRLKFAAGFGADDPRNDRLNPGNRSLNRTCFLNVKFTVCKGCWIGLEYQGFWTDYLRQDQGVDNRFQATFYFKF